MMKGVVKSVLSGDTIVVMDNSRKNALPPQKRISLSGILAPRLAVRGKEDGSSSADEPFAWEAREFLRTNLVGKVVSFALEHVQPATETGQERCFGTVLLEGENMACSLVERGLARTRGGEKFLSPRQSMLVELESVAATAKMGIHSDNLNATKRQVVDRDSGLDPRQLLSAYKGRRLSAIVEAVFNAGSMRVLLLPTKADKTFYLVNFNLSGVRTPSMKGRQTGEPEPFAVEAKFNTESRILHRDCEVILEMGDEGGAGGALFGTLTLPQGNIAEFLVRQGFARLSNWSLAGCTCAADLRKAEGEAKRHRLRVWRDFAPQETTSFAGKVIEVISADSVVVLDNDGTEHRVFLSSIRTRLESSLGAKPEQLQREAKERVRERLIGKKVKVEVEYQRELEKESGPGEVRRYATVTRDSKNVALDLVSAGLAEVIRHRADEPRSVAYEELRTAQEEAEKNKKGKWKPGGTVSAKHVNDLSGDKAKAQAFVPTFERQKNHTAIVQFVVNGGRFKVLVPKLSCIIPFALAGVRVPMCERRDKKGPAAEPFGNEAYQFARYTILQRECEIEVETIDRGGTFLGHLFINKDESKPFSAELLALGYATLQPSAERSPHYARLLAAETSARDERKNIWKGYVEPTPEELAKAAASEAQAPKQECMDVTVTDVREAGLFYVRPVAEPSLESQVRTCVEGSQGGALVELKKGKLVAAQFSVDKEWYRARVVKVADGMVDVVYVDYGNEETVKRDTLRALSTSLATKPPQAFPATLAFVKCPSLEEDHGDAAAHALAGLVLDRRFTAKLTHHMPAVTSSMPPLELVLIPDPADGGEQDNINTQMCGLGFARLAKRVPKWVPAEELQQLKDAVGNAKTQRLNVWEYGDGFDSDDEDPPLGRGRK